MDKELVWKYFEAITDMFDLALDDESTAEFALAISAALGYMAQHCEDPEDALAHLIEEAQDQLKMNSVPEVTH